MASSIGRWISQRIWGRKGEEAPKSSLREFPDFSSELEYLNDVHGGIGSGGRVGSNFARDERRRRRREERVDKENDMVIVSSDEGFLSSSESDDSDWSVGWLEPNGPDFQDENGSDSSFAVIVPCYGRGRQSRNEGLRSNVLGGVDFVSEDRPDNINFIEEWLFSLQKIDTEGSVKAEIKEKEKEKDEER